MDARHNMLLQALKMVSTILAWGEIFAGHQKHEPSYFVLSQYVSQRFLTTAKLILWTISPVHI